MSRLEWPYYEEDSIQAVTNVLKSGKVNQWTGNEVKMFEKEFSEYIGTKYAIAVSNGTTALELALYALDIKEGDEVIVTSRTFVASANCIITRGATPIFADVDLKTQNISLKTVIKCITDKTKAIITVHLAGMPCDMDPIMNYVKNNNIYVIEDCAQAHGAKYKGRMVGSIGDINAWSFCQDKIMSTGGEGGMITLNDEMLYKKAWSYKDHGKNYDLIFSDEMKKNKLFKFVHTIPGTNMRMTEMQAAIGRVLLKKLDNWVKTRRTNADILKKSLEKLDIFDILEPGKDYYHSYYKFYAFLNDIKINRNDLIEYLNKNGVKCYSGSCSEIYLEKAYSNIDSAKSLNVARHPNVKKLGEISLMFLVHPTIDIVSYTKDIINFVKLYIECLNEKQF